LAQQEFAHDSGGLMAGAVAFFASLSLIPLGLLLISAIGHLIGSEQAFSQIEQTVRQYFPGSSRMILNALDTTRTSSGRVLVDIVATFGLLWAGMNLFTTLSLILTIVWVGRPKQSFFARKAVSLLALIVAGIVFLASTIFTSAAASISSYATTISALSPYMQYVDLFNSALSRLVQFVLVSAMFFLLYWLLPAGRVSVPAALLAAAPAALLWLASRGIFAALVVGSSRYGQLYGPLAGAVVLLLWVYYSAYIMILCGEIGAVLQKRYWTAPMESALSGPNAGTAGNAPETP
jgi:YihY family inner membrane protein